MTTPVTDTYIQMAKVYGAIALCRAKLPFRARAKRDQDERHDDCCKNCMREQQGEVKGARDALSLKVRHSRRSTRW